MTIDRERAAFKALIDHLKWLAITVERVKYNFDEQQAEPRDHRWRTTLKEAAHALESVEKLKEIERAAMAVFYLHGHHKPPCMCADCLLAKVIEEHSDAYRSDQATVKALRAASRQEPDANCLTMPNGDCVSDIDCMHQSDESEGTEE